MRTILACLIALFPAAALAQPYTAYPGTNGQIPSVVIVCPPTGSGATTPQNCTFGGGGGGTVSQGPGSASNPWWIEGLGTAGTPSGGVLSIQGVAGGTAQAISAATLPLPSGAATATNQTAVQSAAGTSAGLLETVQGSASGVAIPVSGTFYQSTQPISAASLPLPTGAATASSITAVTAPLSASAATATNTIIVGCKYNSTPPVFTNTQQGGIACDTSGAINVDTEAQKSAYSADATITLASAATDAFQICGSASKNVRVREIVLNGIATTAGGLLTSIIERSTADTGGTSTTPTSVPNDSNNAATVATLNAYTANPTTGTTLGTVRSAYVAFPLVASAQPPVFLEFGATHGDQALVLRGAAQCLVINFGGATIPAGASLTTSIEYTLE